MDYFFNVLFNFIESNPEISNDIENIIFNITESDEIPGQFFYELDFNSYPNNKSIRKECYWFFKYEKLDNMNLNQEALNLITVYHNVEKITIPLDKNLDDVKKKINSYLPKIYSKNKEKIFLENSINNQKKTKNKSVL